MWNLVSEHRSSGILARSYRAKEEQIEDKFAVGLFFGSYESRGLVSSKLLQKNSCEISIIVFFKEKDKEGLREKYDELLYKQVKKCSVTIPVTIKNKSITEVEEILKNILQKIPNQFYSASKRWLIDTSVSPKPYFLGLLGYLRGRIESPALTLFNSTGFYEKNRNSKDAFSFTEGFEEYIWVPWLWGRPDPKLPWTYVFLLGFEGDRSYGTYDRFEPDHVKALISRPGYRPNYTEVAEQRNRQFLEEACPQRIYADAGNAVEAWSEIDKCLAESRQNSNICIVPLGPKPHAIGGCLGALTDGKPAILYLMPRSFKVNDVPRGDYIWKYEITL